MRLDSSVVQPCSSADKLLLHDIEDSRSKNSWQISVWVLQSFEVLFPIPLVVPQILPVSIGVDLQQADAKFSEFPKNAVLLEQIHLQKRVLMYPMSSV